MKRYVTSVQEGKLPRSARSIGYKQVFQWFFAPVGTSYEVKELKIALEEVFNHQQKRQKGFV